MLLDIEKDVSFCNINQILNMPKQMLSRSNRLNFPTFKKIWASEYLLEHIPTLVNFIRV